MRILNNKIWLLYWNWNKSAIRLHQKCTFGCSTRQTWIWKYVLSKERVKKYQSTVVVFTSKSQLPLEITIDVNQSCLYRCVLIVFPDNTPNFLLLLPSWLHNFLLFIIVYGKKKQARQWRALIQPPLVSPPGEEPTSQ